MKLYRFSPIEDNETCLETLSYIDEKLRELSSIVLEEKLPINTLKIFAHYDNEYSFLRQWIDSIGSAQDESSKTSYYIEPSSPMIVNNDPIEYVGIRVVDPYRGQVGCGDFVVNNFDEFKEKYLGKSEFIREVPHQKYEMLELFHPDIDVLGYIVKEYS